MRNVTLGLIVAASVALTACGSPRGQRASAPHTATPALTAGPTMTPTPAVTVLQASGDPVPGTPPAWQHANIPAGFGMAFHESALAVAPSDGRTAYSCTLPAHASAPQVIVTHDRGATWTRVADLPAGWPSCAGIEVDKLSPSTVVAYAELDGNPSAISTDGGASWRLVDGSDPISIVRLATRGTRTYAILANQGPSAITFSLGFSDDGLHTWHVIDTGQYRDVWVNPANGALLVERSDGLWSSADQGQHWTSISAPIPGVSSYVVQPPSANVPWHVCGSFLANSDGTAVGFVCSTDSGATWSVDPGLPSSGTSWSGRVAGFLQGGSLLVLTWSSLPVMLYMLPAGATRWQMLGAMPPANGEFMCAPAGHNDVLWALPTESDGAGAAEPADAVYSAAYP